MKTLLLIAVFAIAAQAQLAVSRQYPLQAHIVSVETVEQQHLTDGNGETSASQLVKAEIEGKTYHLSVKRPFFQKHGVQQSWVQPGFFPARQTKHGFEFEYMDGDKLRHEELNIVDNK